MNGDRSLLPTHNVGRWQVGLCHQNCGSFCCLVTWCPYMPMALMAERIRSAGYEVSTGGFNIVITSYNFLVLLCFIIILSFSAPGIIWVFLVVLFYAAVLLTQLSGFVRHRYAIPGSIFEDALCSTFCCYCKVVQLSYQLWSNPEVEVGCNCCNVSPAFSDSNQVQPYNQVRYPGQFPTHTGVGGQGVPTTAHYTYSDQRGGAIPAQAVYTQPPQNTQYQPPVDTNNPISKNV